MLNNGDKNPTMGQMPLTTGQAPWELTLYNTIIGNNVPYILQVFDEYIFKPRGTADRVAAFDRWLQHNTGTNITTLYILCSFSKEPLSIPSSEPLAAKFVTRVFCRNPHYNSYFELYLFCNEIEFKNLKINYNVIII